MFPRLSRCLAAWTPLNTGLLVLIDGETTTGGAGGGGGGGRGC